MNNVAQFNGSRPDCCHCEQAGQCFPRFLANDGADLERFAGTVKRKRLLRRGEHVFLQGQPQEMLSLVRSGSFKLYALDEDGEEQVLGFLLSGEVLGLDAVGIGWHRCNAVALETSCICELSFNLLDQAAGESPTVRRWINDMFCREIAREHSLLRLLGKKSAEQRLAGFVLDLSRRLGARGYSPYSFTLSMSRHEIGDHLGLALETVSRLLNNLQRRRLLAVNRREISILDPQALARIAGLDAAAEVPTARRRGARVGNASAAA